MRSYHLGSSDGKQHPCYQQKFTNSKAHCKHWYSSCWKLYVMFHSHHLDLKCNIDHTVEEKMRTEGGQLVHSWKHYIFSVFLVIGCKGEYMKRKDIPQAVHWTPFLFLPSERHFVCVSFLSRCYHKCKIWGILGEAFICLFQGKFLPSGFGGERTSMKQ